VYHVKSSGVYVFTVSATRPHFDITANASLSVNVLDQVSGLRLTTHQPRAVLHTDSTGESLFTDPVVFTARYCMLFVFLCYSFSCLFLVPISCQPFMTDLIVYLIKSPPSHLALAKR